MFQPKTNVRRKRSSTGKNSHERYSTHPLMMFPFTLAPTVQLNAGELRGASIYDVEVDWVSSLPRTSCLTSGTPGDDAPVGSAEAQTIRDGFSFGNAEEHKRRAHRSSAKHFAALMRFRSYRHAFVEWS